MKTGKTTPPQNHKPSLWLRVVVPVLLLVIWFAAAGLGGPTFGKLSSVSSNDQASFLPSSADSTKVQDLQTKFTDSTAIPAIVVVTTDKPLDPQTLGQLTALNAKMAAVKGVESGPSVVGPIPSKDGQAVEFIVPISDTENIDKVVKDLRTSLDGQLPAGAQSYVTGPGGLIGDLTTAFGGIDGILLLVAVVAVFIILLVVYRSIILPFVVLLTAMFALCAAILVVYTLAKAGTIKLDGQSQGILSILVIGAATDYALLLSARYREGLEHMESKWEAIWQAIRASFEPIAAAAATVVLALLCLLFSDLNSNRSLGPIAAIGIVSAFLASLTLLPVLLALFGRWAFWPFRPKRQAISHDRDNPSGVPGLQGITGIWERVGRLIARRPRAVWIVTLAILAVGLLGLPQLKATGVSQTDIILSKSNAVDGQKVLAKHFDAGSGSPVVIIASADKADAALAAVKGTNGVSSAVVYAGPVNPAAFAAAPAAPVVKDNLVLIDATLSAAPSTPEADKVIKDLRANLPKVDSAALVGGTTAINLDTNTTARDDLYKIFPIVLVVILIVLILLLRSLLAPILLIVSVVLSYLASLGVSALVFNHIFHFPGADASVPLFGFIFLVALGVDYNIFLMTRVREESQQIGTRPGILHGLGKTGSVITSAGIVLAATFAALGVIPILFLAQIAFIVSFGVLLDTIIVRSLLVPAASYDIGKAIWWPSKLWRNGR